MKRVLPCLCLLALLLCATSVPVPSASAIVDIEAGDYWEYELDQADLAGIEYNATAKLEVSAVDDITIGDETRSVFRCALSGSGSVSGSIDLMSLSGLFNDTLPINDSVSVSGTLTVTGEQVRLNPSFSLVSQNVILNMTVSASTLGLLSFSMSIVAGISTTFTPPFDEFVGDDELVLNTVITSNPHLLGTTYLNFSVPPILPGLQPISFNQTQEIDVEMNYSMRIVDTGVPLETKAGTFDCYVVNATTTEAGNQSFEKLYYSEEVGNYVRYEGGDLTGGMLGGGMTLVAYSRGGSSVGSLLLLGGVAVALVVVVAVVALVLMKKKGGATPVLLSPPPPE